jgi:hypothetical protein
VAEPLFGLDIVDITSFDPSAKGCPVKIAVACKTAFECRSSQRTA